MPNPKSWATVIHLHPDNYRKIQIRNNNSRMLTWSRWQISLN